MVARILIDALGGMWSVRERIHKSKNGLLKRFYLFVYHLYQYENGAGIAYDATFHGVPCLPHGIKGIFISGTAEIGKNCVIFQQVTVGSVMLPDAKSGGKAAKIGDNCYIGSGAKIVGNITIGNNVRIGANCVVYKDVPDNSVVVSAVQQNISKEEPMDNHFYSRHNGVWSYCEDGIWYKVQNPDLIQRLERFF